jgi:hypothetical protein
MNPELHAWKKQPALSDLLIQLTDDFSNECLQIAGEGSLCEKAPNDLLVSVELQEFSKILLGLLKENPGFIVLKTPASRNDEELRSIYAVISRTLGLLNDRYGYFFDVIDQGLDYTKEAIPVSKTKASTGYHTDSTAKEYFPDIVGLLCLHPGASGGESQITNAADVYLDLKNSLPTAVAALEEPVIRDVITPGTMNSTVAILNNAFPVFSDHDGMFTFRYMRYWIETAHSKTAKELSSELLNGLEAIDSYFSKPEHTVQFKMERGEMLFLNNRFLCHNRTAFENNSVTQKPRTLVRTWINFEN